MFHCTSTVQCYFQRSGLKLPPSPSSMCAALACVWAKGGGGGGGGEEEPLLCERPPLPPPLWKHPRGRRRRRGNGGRAASSSSSSSTSLKQKFSFGGAEGLTRRGFFCVCQFPKYWRKKKVFVDTRLFFFSFCLFLPYTKGLLLLLGVLTMSFSLLLLLGQQRPP